MSSFRTIVAALAVAAVLALPGCSVEDSLAAPNCVTGESGLIVAQSVPGAEFVPCLSDLPTGWVVDVVTVTEEGTVIRFDSDRAGDDSAELHFAGRCDVGGAVSVPSDHDGVEAFERIERLTPGFRGERHFTFPTGCVWWRFDFDEGVTAARSIELGNSLSLFSRRDLNDTIRETFLDEEI